MTKQKEKYLYFSDQYFFLYHHIIESFKSKQEFPENSDMSNYKDIYTFTEDFTRETLTSTMYNLKSYNKFAMNVEFSIPRLYILKIISYTSINTQRMKGKYVYDTNLENPIIDQDYNKNGLFAFRPTKLSKKDMEKNIEKSSDMLKFIDQL